MQLTQDAFLYLAMAIFSFVLCFMAWQRRLVVGAFELCLLMVFIGFWSFMLFCESASTEFSIKLLWSKASYAFVTFSPVLFLIFVYRFLGKQSLSKIKYTLFLFVVPAITIYLVWTNDSHHLMWTKVDVLNIPGSLLHYQRGLWFWIGVVFYSYLMLGIATWSLGRYVIRKLQVLKTKGWLLLSASLLPVLSSFLFLSGIEYELVVKIIPFMVLASGGLFTVAFYYTGFYNTLPVARELLVEILPDGIITLDNLNRVQDINKKAIQMLGLTRKQKLGLDLMQVDSQRMKLTEAILSTIKDEVVKVEGEEERVYHVFKESAKSLQGSRLVVIRDISEAINNQQKIQAEEQKYRELSSFFRLLADNMPDMLWAKDLELRYTFANKVLAEEVLLAGTTDKAIGKTLRDFSQSCTKGENTTDNSAFWAQSDQSDKAVIETRQSYMSDEHVCVKGLMKELDVRKAPIFDEQGNMVGIVGSARDVTHQRQMEHELVNARNKAEESDRLKSAFLANMSHEIRTPMNTILGFVSLLQESDLTEKEQNDYLQIVRDSSERLLSTLSDIIDLSKVEAGYTTPTFSDFDVQDLFMNLYLLQKKPADEKQLLFIRQWNLPSELIFICSDKEKVYSIASNLVNNAIKYTSQGFVEFRCNLTRDRLELTIKDTGIGIPAEKQQSIFERFIQVDTSHQRAFEGAGLGLSITKAYVEMLGGTINLESELGRGSIFYVSLPISIADVYLHDA